jgi:hypothetical protein
MPQHAGLDILDGLCLMVLSLLLRDHKTPVLHDKCGRMVMNCILLGGMRADNSGSPVCPHKS